MNGAVSSRYAASLADVAIRENNADRVKRDLASLAEAFSSSADLRNFLETPAVGPEAKRKVIEKIAAQMDLAPAVRNFAYLLVDHHRTELLHEIRQAFDTELNSRLGIAEAKASSARALSGEQRDILKKTLERRTGKKIEMQFAEDSSLVAGAVVRVGSTVYDGSVREQLIRLRGQLETE